ncbi:CD209 antigen-like protein A isoform X1 [Oreochromis niloticus]|uniref:CD209 antigen-like protein A isoform X1 n=1 Tax=Oreochromis niloticus TaxID=8128 RepID=UPI000DF13D96|nr:CD209 antigen-like protein A isoform X1 [Oreochromis niloticus]
MSAEVQAAADFRVKYSRRTHSDGREREYSEVQMIDDGEQHPDVGLQEAGDDTQKKLPAGKRSSFRGFEVNLGVLYLLILAAITTRYALNKSQLQDELQDTKTNLTQLQSSYDKLSKNHSQLQEEVKKLKEKIEGKWCPEEWTRFGSKFYFKSTERKTWSNSQKHCKTRGADLVMINSKEEQEFIRNMRGGSWIGLTGWNYEWEWVDGSALTQTFWAEGHGNPSSGSRGVCCDDSGRWTGSHYSESKTFICEK